MIILASATSAWWAVMITLGRPVVVMRAGPTMGRPVVVMRLRSIVVVPRWRCRTITCIVSGYITRVILFPPSRTTPAAIPVITTVVTIAELYRDTWCLYFHRYLSGCDARQHGDGENQDALFEQTLYEHLSTPSDGFHCRVSTHYLVCLASKY